MIGILIAFGTIVGGLLLLVWRCLELRMRNEKKQSYEDATPPIGPRRCRSCRAAVVEEDSVYCPKCGAALDVATRV